MEYIQSLLNYIRNFFGRNTVRRNREAGSSSRVDDVAQWRAVLPYTAKKFPRREIFRLQQEYRDITLDPPEYCSVKVIGNNIENWEATIRGPADTPYENGVFKIHIRFPKTYPFCAPIVRCITKIYHCNISQEGKICFNTMYTDWTASITVSNILSFIVFLMKNANPLTPSEPKIALEYIRNREEHDAVARQWTQLYAIEPSPNARIEEVEIWE